MLIQYLMITKNNAIELQKPIYLNLEIFTNAFYESLLNLREIFQKKSINMLEEHIVE